MNAPIPALAPARATPFRAKTFAAFRITDNPARTRPVQITGDPATLDQARDGALGTFIHGEKLLIRETEDGRVTLHLYAIKRKSAPEYVWVGHEQKRVNRLYAEKVCEIDGRVL